MILRAAPLLLLLAMMLAGCTVPPSRAVYVLGENPMTGDSFRSNAGLPVLEVRRVALPSYLDNTDLLKRSGLNQFSASTTGRWGERLSLGLTEDLAASLARRLSGWQVSLDPMGATTRRLVVAVSEVDITLEGACRLSAQWSLLAADGHSVLGSWQGSFTALATAADDAAEVVALSRTVDQLADQVAGSVTESLP